MIPEVLSASEYRSKLGKLPALRPQRFARLGPASAIGNVADTPQFGEFVGLEGEAVEAAGAIAKLFYGDNK